MAKKRKVRLKHWRGLRVRYIDAGWLVSLKKSRLSFEVRELWSGMYPKSRHIYWSARVSHPDEAGVVGRSLPGDATTPEAALNGAHADLLVRLRNANRDARLRAGSLGKAYSQASGLSS